MLKNQKHLVRKITNKREKINLIDKLQMCTRALENKKLEHESDIQQLQCELASVERSLTSITTLYEKSQEAIREYSLAMDELLQLSQSNKERYDSLITNHMCDCQHLQNPGPVYASLLNSQLCVGPQKCEKQNTKTIMFSDEIGKNMGQILNSRIGHSVVNHCLPYSSLHEIMEIITKSSFSCDSNLIIWVGNRGNVNKAELINYIEKLSSLKVNKIVMFTLPYSNSLPQVENDLRHKLNMTLHTILCNNNLIHLIDSNNIVGKNYYMTKGRYYLPNYYKRQVAVSLSYFFSITAKNLAKQTDSIEQYIDPQNVTMETIPSHLN